MKNSKKAFSLIEISVVILIIGILITGIAQGSRLVTKSKLSSAQNLTKTSSISDIANLGLWLETTLPDGFINSAGSPSIKNEESIATWKDINPQISNKKNATKTTPTNQPKYIKNGFNNLPVVRFDGVDDRFELPNDTVPSGNSPYTVFLVFNPSSTNPTNAGILSLGNYGADNTHTDFYYHGSNRYMINSWRNVQNINSPVNSITPNKMNLVVINYDATTNANARNIYINKSLVTTSSATPHNAVSGPTRIGFVAQGATAYFNGDIAEIVVFSSFLDDRYRKIVEDYLSKKWSIN